MSEKLTGKYLAFYKWFFDQPFEWMVVIVDVNTEERSGAVVDVMTGSREHCQEFASGYLGLFTEVVYTAPLGEVP